MTYHWEKAALILRSQVREQEKELQGVKEQLKATTLQLARMTCLYYAEESRFQRLKEEGKGSS